MWRSTPRPDAQTVLEAAVELAFADGLRAVTHASVAERLGVPARLVAEVAPNASVLVADAFGTIVTTELADIKRLVLGNPSPVAQMTALLGQFAEPAEAAADGVWLEAWSLGRVNRSLAARVCDEEARWHDFVASVIRRGVRAGDFLENDPEAVAAQLLAMMDGVNAYALVGYRTAVDRMQLLTSFARTELGLDWAAAAR